MVVGRVFRGIGRFAGRIHGTVFRALGRLPLVGGAFKMLGNISAKGLGMLGAMTPMAMLGLGEYSPFSSYTSGFAEASIAEQNGTGARGLGRGFNNVFGAPIDMAGQHLGIFGGPNTGGYGHHHSGYGYNRGYPGVYGNNMGYGMPFHGYPQQQCCCCCCGYRGF